MKNDIIKNSSIANINPEKAELNKGQLEESQKKAILDKSALEKTLEENEPKKDTLGYIPHISFKDGSNKIKLDNETSDTSISNDNISYVPIPKTTEEKITYKKNNSKKEVFSINDFSAQKMIKNKENVNNIIKSNDSISGVIKNNETNLIKNDKEPIIADEKIKHQSKRKSNFKAISSKNNINQKNNDYIEASDYDNTQASAFRYVEGNNNVNFKDSQPIIEYNEMKIDIMPEISEVIKSTTSEEKLGIKNNKVSNKSETKQSSSSYLKAIAVDKAKGYAINAVKKTDDTKALGLTIATAETAYKILKSDKQISEKIRGNRRNLNLNSADIEKKSIMLGIKKEVANDIKDSILQTNNSVKKIATVTASNAKKGIRDVISEKSNEDIEIKGINSAINLYQTAKAIEKTTVVAGKSSVELVKGVAKAPKNIANGARTLKKRVKKAQKIMRMSKTAQKKLIKSTVKNGVKAVTKKITNDIINASKGFVIKIVGGLVAVFLLMIVITSAFLLMISSFFWQTEKDIDTTQMVKYIAELDFERQKAWYSKGKTNIDIEKSNDRSSRKYYSYNYLLAVDVPPEIGVDDDVVSTGAINCYIKTGFNSNGEAIKPSYGGFNESFSSADEMLENYRWTTDDYFAALAFLQVKNENLGWFNNMFGWAGQSKLKNSMKELHEKTYDHKIVNQIVEDGKTKYEFVDTIRSESYSKDSSFYYYYFGRKYSVKYIIDNDMIRFDDDDIENARQKERFENIYKYGNLAVANLSFPLEISDDEDIRDRIVKHFGKQLSLEYIPPEEPDDDEEDVYGKVVSHTSYHYANDLMADAGDCIYAPIGGLCKVTQRDERGFEFEISTAYTDNEIDYTKDGYLIKMSCASSTYISTGTTTFVKKGAKLGKVAKSISANYTIPDSENDENNEDIFANKLFPCSTGTTYSRLGRNKFDIPKNDYEHLHIEMYKLPCDFTNVNSIEENVLAPELFFSYKEN